MRRLDGLPRLRAPPSREPVRRELYRAPAGNVRVARLAPTAAIRTFEPVRMMGVRYAAGRAQPRFTGQRRWRRLFDHYDWKWLRPRIDTEIPAWGVVGRAAVFATDEGIAPGVLVPITRAAVPDQGAIELLVGH